jgi:hypothetical protein
MTQVHETSHEDKVKILTCLTPLVADIEKYPSVGTAVREATIQAIGQTIAYYTIRKWAKADEEIGELLSIALLERAENYLAKSFQVLENIEEFWESSYVTSDGRQYTITKERVSAVNRAKLRVEAYRWYAANLAPDVYGDYKHELKKVNDQMKLLRDQIDAIIDNKL